MEIRRRPPNPKIQVSSLEYAIPHEDSEPRNILEKIVWEKDREINISRQRVPLDELKSQVQNLPETKDFLGALKKTPTVPAIIAEIKKASPSKGVIRKEFDPVLIAKAYKEGGASCLSVLTDKSFFQGGFDVLVQVRKAIDLPILCKDFILEPYQIYQARVAGADAILLIASILSDQDLKYLKKIALNLGLAVLVETHNSEELKRIFDLGGFDMIGVNNRNLKSFETDITITKELYKEYESSFQSSGSILVSESGLFTREDLDQVVAFGANAVLIGEALMRQSDIKNALRNLISQ